MGVAGPGPDITVCRFLLHGPGLYDKATVYLGEYNGKGRGREHRRGLGTYGDNMSTSARSGNHRIERGRFRPRRTVACISCHL